MKTLTNQWIVVTVVWSLLTLLLPSPSMACDCILSGETKLAQMQFPGETHCYVFWGEAGQGTVIQIADDDSSWRPRIQLYDPNGARVAEAVAGSYPYTYSAIENYRLEMEGVYTIVVSYGGGTNEYGLSLALTGGSMTSPGDADGGDVSPSAARSGTIAPLGDTDIYVFRGHMGQGIVIEMADDDYSSCPPRIQLYDPNGDRVAEAVDGSYPYTYTAIENYQLKATGIYTVVASYDGGVGAYGLSVSVMPPKEPRGLYPYGPQPADGQVIDYCDPNTAFSDVVVENLVLPGGTVVTRHSSPYLLSWWSVLGATGYDVYFSAGPCLPLEKIAENVADPWIPMPEIENEQVCSWRVVAHTPAGDIQGPTWWFMACCVPPPPDGCTLTVKVVGQGSIEGATEGLNEYPCGEIVSIKAKPDAGYEFVRWEGSATDGMEDPTEPEMTVIVDDDTLTAVFEEILYEATMDEDPDWTLEDPWEYGMPTGQRCGAWGNNDPTSGCTGPNVIAVNLNGCYDQTIGGPYYATTNAIDLSGYEGIRLRFCRWLNCDIPEYVRCTVEVSTDGQHWTLLWTQAEREEITDTDWTICEYPLPEADCQPTVYLRWGYHVLRERAYAYTGWNLDDVQLIGRRP